MKNLIKKIKPVYYILNKIRSFKLETIHINLHYLYCLLTKKPYFGKKYGASMLNKEEAEVLIKLLQRTISLGGSRNYLEVGSWAGASASVLGKVIKESGLKRLLYCVDVWRGTGDGIKITKGEINGNTIFGLFKRNIKYAGVKDYIVPMQMTSDKFFEQCSDKFSFIYIDGDHRYTQAKKDIENAFKYLEVGGIMCGDDLDYFSNEVDMVLTKEKAENDITTDKDGRTYHPGVTLAIKEIFDDKVGLKHSVWSIQKTQDGWVSYNI